jgi:hypothetical protein
MYAAFQDFAITIDMDLGIIQNFNIAACCEGKSGLAQYIPRSLFSRADDKDIYEELGRMRSRPMAQWILVHAWHPGYWKTRDLYLKYWAKLRPYIQLWWSKEKEKGVYKKNKERITDGDEQYKNKYVVYLRCSDTPFIKHADYPMAGRSFYEEAAGVYVGLATKGVNVPELQLQSCNFHKSEVPEFEDRKKSCAAYTEWIREIITNNYARDVPIICDSVDSDFNNLAEAEHVWGNYSSFVVMARLCGNKKWADTTHFPTSAQNLPHGSVSTYYDHEAVIKQLDTL